VMIAMALMCEPELIIADEPTTALDVTIQAQILRLLADLKRELNMALILVTHDLGVVARIADKVAVMYAGEIIEAGTATEIFDRPAHPYTRGLLRCIPVPGKTKPGEPLGSIPGIVPSLIGGIEGCAFRDRCELAEAACSRTVAPKSAGGQHWYRCIQDIADMEVAS
jgi:peptide/nickel transport system ATP-binding protein